MEFSNGPLVRFLNADTNNVVTLVLEGQDQLLAIVIPYSSEVVLLSRDWGGVSANAEAGLNLPGKKRILHISWLFA